MNEFTKTSFMIEKKSDEEIEKIKDSTGKSRKEILNELITKGLDNNSTAEDKPESENEWILSKRLRNDYYFNSADNLADYLFFKIKRNKFERDAYMEYSQSLVTALYEVDPELVEDLTNELIARLESFEYIEDTTIKIN